MNCGVVPVSAGSAHIGTSVMNEMQCIALSCPYRSGLPAHFCNTKVYLTYIRLDLVEVVERQQSFQDNMKNSPSRRLRRGHWAGPRRSRYSTLRCSLTSVRRLVYRRSIRERRSLAKASCGPQCRRRRIRCCNTKTLFPCVNGLLDQVRDAFTCSVALPIKRNSCKPHHARGVEG